MTVIGIDGTGDIIPEPDWTSLFNDELEIAAASEYWRVLTTELRERTLLTPANTHSLQRTVCHYIVFDRACRQVAEVGAVSKPKRGSTRAIARVSPHYTVMREASADAAASEAELGISPRRRGAVTKAERGKKAPRAADRFLKSIP
ncbi:P27 family phage terminase small subunit [Xanthobacteraceae bacterium A53D]